MTANRLTTIWCDGSPTADRMSCGAWVESDYADEARKIAKAQGWVVNVKDGEDYVRRDYCPVHAPALT